MTKRNIAAGDFTWAERIAMGKILSSDQTPYQKAQALLNLLHPNDNLLPALYGDYLQSIIDGLQQWAALEQQYLTIPPTPEEQQAGVDQLHQTLAETAAIINVAKAYHICPDDIIQWPYPTIFMHLKVEAQQELFARRLQAVYNKK